MDIRPSKIVCIGRSYAENTKTFKKIPVDNPLIFIKPPSSLSNLSDGIVWNHNLGRCSHECEIVLRISKTLKNESNPQKAIESIDAITLGLDLTLKDLQDELKSKGQPWERCKAYDGSCLLADWINLDEIDDLKSIKFDFKVNNVTRHYGDTSLIIYDIGELLSHISKSFTLEVGDIIMTGCPAGGDYLKSGDEISMSLFGKNNTFTWQSFVQ